MFVVLLSDIYIQSEYKKYSLCFALIDARQCIYFRFCFSESYCNSVLYCNIGDI